MVEVYDHSGVLAPEDRVEDCLPWLHELGWRPAGWVFSPGKAQPLCWPAAVMSSATAAGQDDGWRQPHGPVSVAGTDRDWVDLRY